MVREFHYGGDRFRATVHGRPGKEEIFIVQVLEDGEEGAEISLDRFEDVGNNPDDSLELVLAKMVDHLRVEQGQGASQVGQPFAWSEGKVLARVHSGVQQ